MEVVTITQTGIQPRTFSAQLDSARRIKNTRCLVTIFLYNDHKIVVNEYIVIRMTTSISREARRNQTTILIRGRKNHVSPKPDRQTDIHTDGRTLAFIEQLRYSKLQPYLMNNGPGVLLRDRGGETFQNLIEGETALLQGAHCPLLPIRRGAQPTCTRRGAQCTCSSTPSVHHIGCGRCVISHNHINHTI